MASPLTEEVITALSKYQWCFGLDDIERIYPKDVVHMSEKWSFCQRNLLAFWGMLSSDNREILLEDIQYQHFYLKKRE